MNTNWMSAPSEQPIWLFLNKGLICFLVCTLFTVHAHANDDPVEGAESKLPATITELIDDWFWTDPYSHLGQRQSSGPGWEFVRVAGDFRAGLDAGLSKDQLTIISDIYRDSSKMDPKGKPADREKYWRAVETKVRGLLEQTQQDRVDQLVIQRRSYRAFADPALVKKLRLSASQSVKIQEAIKGHSARIAHNTRVLTDQTNQMNDKGLPLSDEDRIRSAKLKREKVQRGWLSLRQVWDDIREILSTDQEASFQKIRGERPGKAHGKPDAEPVEQQGNAQIVAVPMDHSSAVEPSPQIHKAVRVRSAAEQTQFEMIKERLTGRLLDDLKATENTNPGSVMMTAYGDVTPSIGSPLQLFYSMVPPAYRDYMRWHPKLHQLEFDRDKSVHLSQETLALVEAGLPLSLDAAIALMLESSVKPARLAAEVLRVNRLQLSVTQWTQIVEGYQFAPMVREEYPVGVEVSLWGSAAIPFGFLLFDDLKIAGFATDSRSLLDGNQIATFSGGGWRNNFPGVFLGKESLGVHTIEYQDDFTLVVGRQVVKGHLTSGKIKFTVVPKEPDMLVAEVSDRLREQVTSSIKVLPIAEGRERTYSRAGGDGKFEPIAKLKIPFLDLPNPLPVALAMKVDVYFEDLDKPHKRPNWVVPVGQISRYEVEGMIGDGQLIETLAARADENGRVDARIVLTPSRSEALSHALIESYYPEPIEIRAQWQLLWTEPKAP